jgi:hypothetical protein
MEDEIDLAGEGTVLCEDPCPDVSSDFP